jgi:hypothetical protein
MSLPSRYSSPTFGGFLFRSVINVFNGTSRAGAKSHLFDSRTRSQHTWIPEKATP